MEIGNFAQCYCCAGDRPCGMQGIIIAETYSPEEGKVFYVLQVDKTEPKQYDVISLDTRDFEFGHWRIKE